MDIFKYFDNFSCVRDCCINFSCLDDFIDLKFKHTDISSVQYDRQFLVEDAVVSSCPGCAFFPSDEFHSDYLSLSIIPQVISFAQNLGYVLVGKEEWLPGAPSYTLFGIFFRTTRKSSTCHLSSDSSQKLRRNICSIITILPEENIVHTTHFT